MSDDTELDISSNELKLFTTTTPYESRDKSIISVIPDIKFGTRNLAIIEGDDNYAKVKFPDGREFNLDLPFTLSGNLFSMGRIDRFCRDKAVLPSVIDFINKFKSLEPNEKTEFMSKPGFYVEKFFEDDELVIYGPMDEIRISLQDAVDRILLSQRARDTERLRTELQRAISRVWNRWIVCNNSAAALMMHNELEIIVPNNLDIRIHNLVYKEAWKKAIKLGYEPLLTGKSASGKIVTKVDPELKVAPDFIFQLDPFYKISNWRREGPEIRQIRNAHELKNIPKSLSINNGEIDPGIRSRMTELWTVFADFQENCPELLNNDGEMQTFSLDDIVVTNSGANKLTIIENRSERLSDREYKRELESLERKNALVNVVYDRMEGHFVKRYEVQFTAIRPLKRDKIVMITGGAKGTARPVKTSFFIWIPNEDTDHTVYSSIENLSPEHFSVDKGRFQEIDAIVSDASIIARKETNAYVHAAASIVGPKFIPKGVDFEDLASEAREKFGEENLGTDEPCTVKSQDLIDEIMSRLQKRFGRNDGKFLLFIESENPMLTVSDIGIRPVGFAVAGLERFMRMTQTAVQSRKLCKEGSKGGTSVDIPTALTADLTIKVDPKVDKSVAEYAALASEIKALI